MNITYHEYYIYYMLKNYINNRNNEYILNLFYMK